MAEPAAGGGGGGGGGGGASALTKQVGPLPLWVWVALVIGGLGIAFYARKTGGDVETPIVSENSPQTGVGDAGEATVTTPPPPTAPTTNEEWAQLAISQAIAAGFDAGLATDTVELYLAGQNLTVNQCAVRRWILTHVGPPPLLPPTPEKPCDILPIPNPPEEKPPPVEKPPEKPPAKPPSKPKSVTVTVCKWNSRKAPWCSTLWGIAAHYYGNGLLWPRIYAANRSKIKNPNLIYPGQKFVVPNPTRNV